MINASLAPATKGLYKRAWDRFVAFSAEQLQKKARLPIAVGDVLLFGAHLHQQNLAASSILSYLSALAFMHKMHGLADPTRHFVVAKMMAGAKRLSSTHDIRLPITKPVLHTLISAVSKVVTRLYEQRLLTCMFSLAFHGFLRIGEIAAKSVQDAPNVVQLDDIHLPKRDPNYCTLVLRKFKHSGSQGPQTITFKRQSSRICPVHTVRKYLKLRGGQMGPLFIWQGGKPLLRRQFDARLKTVLNFCGYSTTLYRGHSFRIGAATEAAARGCSDAQIRNLGRWRSDAFRKYIRLS